MIVVSMCISVSCLATDTAPLLCCSLVLQVGFNDVDVLRLDLSDCDLSELPPEIGRLTNLTALDLRMNDLQGLPVEIGHLTNLETLELEVIRVFQRVFFLPPIICDPDNLSISFP